MHPPKVSISQGHPGSLKLKSLHLSEKAANDFGQEVAEWSVLDAKKWVEH